MAQAKTQFGSVGHKVAQGLLKTQPGTSWRKLWSHLGRNTVTKQYF
jgi:hypothetical protein